MNIDYAVQIMHARRKGFDIFDIPHGETTAYAQPDAAKEGRGETTAGGLVIAG